MIGRYRHFSLLSNAWLVAGASLAALAVLGVLLWSPWDRPAIAGREPLLVYCAAGLRKPVAEIIADYRKEYGVQVQVTYDNSGNLLTAIRARHDRPDAHVGDLYLANDVLNMRDAQTKYGVVAEAIPVALNRPVLVVNRRTQKTLQKQGKPVASVQDLLRSDLKVALASEAASIGKLMRQLLEPSGIWARLEERRRKSNLVSDFTTVEQVAQTVSLQDGYVGVVWRATAVQYEGLEIVTPPEFEGVTEQAMIGVLTRSRQPTAALQFARYLTARDKGLAIFQKYAFEPAADADFWEEVPEIHLAAGAMLKPGIEEVIKAFERREGVKVNTSFNGCGLLVSQMKGIKKGDAPGRFPDAYFACDSSFLNDVQQWFDAPVTVSQNDVVFIVPKGNPKGVRPTLRELTRPDLRIGLAHPTNSALGKLVDDLLLNLGLHAAVYGPDWQKRIVHTDAAHDLVNKMRAGALDLAVVYRSNALSTPGNVEKYLDILEPDIGLRATQPFAISRESRHKQLVRRLLQAIVAHESAQRFKSLGFHWVYEGK
ncbi:MAG TPA: substrate-binding domain-containing protein [Gemmataceae bacterium]|nr:substrate-binding domain-containing protein [Gemmataceae bacterium]